MLLSHDDRPNVREEEATGRLIMLSGQFARHALDDGHELREKNRSWEIL